MFMNLTPHDITLQAEDGTRHTITSSGVARIDSQAGALVITEGCAGFPAGVPIYDRTVYGAPVGLPDPDPTGATTYIVSAMFAGRVGNRTDVVYPGTGPKDGAIRGFDGKIIAVTRLIRA